MAENMQPEAGPARDRLSRRVGRGGVEWLTAHAALALVVLIA